MMVEGRYRVIDGSNSSHCCFEASVIDTQAPVMDVNGKPIEDWFETVCECLDRAQAERIAAALNNETAQAV